MITWLRTFALAAVVMAMAAAGLASAATYRSAEVGVAPKADRLPVLVAPHTPSVTIETRTDGGSVLNRIPVN